jgi:hypothetical protein
MHVLLLSLGLMDMGARGTGELDHGQERVGRPSFALPRPTLIRKRRQQYGESINHEDEGNWETLRCRQTEDGTTTVLGPHAVTPTADYPVRACALYGATMP